MKKICSLVLSICILVCAMPLTSCKNKDNTSSSMKIYYMDKQCTTLLTDDFMTSSSEEEEILQEMFLKLQSDTPGVDKFRAIPESVSVNSLDIDTKTKTLKIDYSKEYEELDKAVEILSRAAVVLTCTQLFMVDYVEIYSDGSPLKDEYGNRIGKLSETSFADNFIGSEIRERTNRDFTLYFANGDYSALVPYKHTGTYLADASLETYIIKELINGPSEEGYNRTLVKETELVSAVTTDGVCYVNFAEDFETLNSGYNTAIVIYSIVNSLLELNYITMVRITINGSSTNTFNGMSLDDSFSKNLDIVEDVSK